MNAPVKTARRITPDDLLAMPDRDRYELVDGQLVETNVSMLSSYVGGKLLRLLGNHGEERGLGWGFPADTQYRCFPWLPNRVRRPDASFIRAERVRPENWPEGFVTIVPDLVVEVVSPNDLAGELEIKLQEYRRAGVRLVWVVYPESRSAQVHRADGSSQDLDEDGTLDGEDVVPGFRVRVGELFPPGAPAPADPEEAAGA